MLERVIFMSICGMSRMLAVEGDSGRWVMVIVGIGDGDNGDG